MRTGRNIRRTRLAGHRLLRPLTVCFLMVAGPPAPAPAPPLEAAFDARRPPAVSAWPVDLSGRSLMRALSGTGRLTVLVLQEESASRLGEVKWGRRDAGETRLLTLGTATRETLRGPLLVVGSFDAAASAYLSTTPCSGLDPPAPGETLRVMSVNPWDGASPMILLTGSDTSTVESAVASGPWPRGWDYEVTHGGMRVRYGRFHSAGSAWRIDPATDVDVRARIRSLSIGPLRVERVDGEVGQEAARAVARQVLDDLGRFVRRLGGSLPDGTGPIADLVVHADRETKGMRTGDPRPAHLTLDPSGGRVGLHVALDSPAEAPEGICDRRLAVARMALRIAPGGLPPPAIADGAAVLMAGGLLGRDLQWWEARLGGLVDASEAADLWVDEDKTTRSYLVLLPLRARALGLIEGKEGAGSLGTLLRRPDLPERLAKGTPGPRRRRMTMGRRGGATASGPPHNGMGLAHEGYGVMDGYGSKNAVEQMRRLKGLGVDWVALSPYGFMPDPREPAIRYNGREQQGAASENDHAVLSTMRSARAMGLRVMLKPQIWLPHGYWTGDVAMGTEPMWRAFFSRYREFLEHYALLAAAGGADLLSVGVELQEASRREKDWRDLIETTRGLFDGPLTYSANWGSEFETLRFWDALDFAGLDCYYPLSDRADPSDADLARGARLAAARAEAVFRRTGRRVLLTEVGFPALASPWMAPHDDARDADPDPVAQARAYRAIFEAFAGKSWLAGLYWWKWPTTPPGNRPDPLFSPRGRPAERVVAEWYGRSGPRAPDWSSGSP